MRTYIKRNRASGDRWGQLPHYALYTLLILGGLGQLRGQATPKSPGSCDSKEQYDVVSIKESHGDQPLSIAPSVQAFQARGASAADLIAYSLDVRKDLIRGIPRSIENKRFDLTAKRDHMDANQPNNEWITQRTCMRSVLQTYFKLTYHTIEERRPVMLLLQQTSRPSSSAPVPMGPPGTLFVTSQSLSGRGVSAEDIAKALATVVKREVVNKTDNTSPIDISLHWRPDIGLSADDGRSTDVPDLYRALREQSTFELKAGRADVDVVQIDSMEMPILDE